MGPDNQVHTMHDLFRSIPLSKEEGAEFILDDSEDFGSPLFSNVDLSPATSGSRNSQSDSSNRAASSSSAHTSFPGGDTLAGSPAPNADWQGGSPMSDVLLQQTGCLDDTVDPCSLEKAGALADFASPAFMGQNLHPQTTASSPSNLSPAPVGRNDTLSTPGAVTPGPDIVSQYSHAGPYQLNYLPTHASGPPGGRLRKRQACTDTLHLRTNMSRETSPHEGSFFSAGASLECYFGYATDLISNSNTWTPNRTSGQIPFTPHGLPGNLPTMPQMPDLPTVSGLAELTPGRIPKVSLTVSSESPWKSRVETQINVTITATPAISGVDKLRIARHLVYKAKHMDKTNAQPSPNMLELCVHLVSHTAMQKPGLLEKTLLAARKAAEKGRNEPLDTGFPDEEKGRDVKEGGEVKICNGCMQRERKRIGRKKKTKVEEEQSVLDLEHRRIMLFNGPEISTIEMDETTAAWKPIKIPMRIACYCRHHSEKQGFLAIVTLTDCNGNVLGQTTTPAIMITDDHKTSSFPPTDGVQLPGAADIAVPSLATTLVPQKRSSSTNHIVAPRIHQGPQPQPNRSRPPSPAGTPGPQSKRRKGSGTQKVPPGLTMTALSQFRSTKAERMSSPTLLTLQHPQQQVQSPESHPLDTAPSVTSTAPSRFASPQTPDNPFPAGGDHNPFGAAVPFSINPSTLSDIDQRILAPYDTPHILDNMNALGHSAPVSMHQSRSASPSAYHMTMSDTLDVRFFHQQSQPPPPTIHKLIPYEGSKNGGYECTILGSGFNRNLEVKFGDNKAVTTTYWGGSTLVCLVPPSPDAGPVDVTFEGPRAYGGSEPPQFRYVDDNEVSLLRTALKIVGLGMNTGTSISPRDIAQIIVSKNEGGRGGDRSARGDPSGGTSLAESMNLESCLLKLLEMVDQDDRPLKPRLNIRRLSGHSVLHIACAMGLSRFVAGLISRGINMDLRDKGGYTALHFASLNSHLDIVRRLVASGADPTIRTLSGLTAADVATSPSVLQTLRAAELYAGSRSAPGSHISGFSSTASLRSQLATKSASGIEQVTISNSVSHQESGVSKNSHSDAGSTLSDDEPRLEMRRANKVPKTPRIDRPHTPDSPGTGVTGLKEQFAAQMQQLQQMTAQLLQLSGRLQVPTMPQLPEYQAALLQRLPGFATMVSALGGARPGSSGEQSSASKELDSRWWDLTAFKSSSAPPPAYDEIFPQQRRGGVSDKKQVDDTITFAEAEAKADAVCETLFDCKATETAGTADAGESVSSVSTASEETEEVKVGPPMVLQIGRKNAITKEQQDIIRRARAERFRGLSSDTNLYFIWIPLLLIVVAAMFFGGIPSWLSVSTPSQGTAAPPRVVEV